MVWSVVILYIGCSSNQQNAPAQFRIGQFLLANDSATIEIYKDHELVNSITTGYGKLTAYYTTLPGIYLFKIKTNDQLILGKEIGFGRSGSYTLCLTGYPTENQRVNKQSTMDKLTHIVEGAAALTKNDFLPQLIIQNDFTVNDPGEGQVRAVHFMPGTTPLDLHITKGSEKVLSFPGMKYPYTTEMQPLSPHKYLLILKFAGSTVPHYSKAMNIEKGILHTLYFIPSPNNYSSNPMIILGKTKMAVN